VFFNRKKLSIIKSPSNIIIFPPKGKLLFMISHKFDFIISKAYRGAIGASSQIKISVFSNIELLLVGF